MTNNLNNKISICADSANVPKMQDARRISAEKGSAAIPTMQLAPSKKSSPQAVKQNSTDNKNGK